LNQQIAGPRCESAPLPMHAQHTKHQKKLVEIISQMMYNLRNLDLTYNLRNLDLQNLWYCHQCV